MRSGACRYPWCSRPSSDDPNKPARIAVKGSHAPHANNQPAHTHTLTGRHTATMMGMLHRPVFGLLWSKAGSCFALLGYPHGASPTNSGTVQDSWCSTFWLKRLREADWVMVLDRLLATGCLQETPSHNTQQQPRIEQVAPDSAKEGCTVYCPPAMQTGSPRLLAWDQGLPGRCNTVGGRDLAPPGKS